MSESARFPSYVGDLIVSWEYRPELDGWQVEVHKDEAVDPAVGQLTMTRMVSAEEWKRLPELPIKRSIEDFTRAYQKQGGVVPVERDDIHWWQRMVALLAQKLCEERGADRIMVGERDIVGSQGLYAILQETPEGVEITPQRDVPTKPPSDGEFPLLIPGLWGEEPDAIGTFTDEMEHVKRSLDELTRQQREMMNGRMSRYERLLQGAWKQVREEKGWF